MENENKNKAHSKPIVNPALRRPPHLAHWIMNDRQVKWHKDQIFFPTFTDCCFVFQILCFIAYFREEIEAITSYQIRKVKIYYYLEDGTIQVNF